jgi:DNA repair photolyase
MKKFKERPEEWGYFVDVKVNAPIVLAKEVKKIKPPKEVFMSSICDAWQPMEAKYRLSRDCLKVLLEAGFSVSMLTKSSLILRDFDILAAHKNASLGMTITTLEPGLQKALEPYASPVKDRLNTLKQAQSKGIETWVFLGPLLPEFTDTKDNLEALFKALKNLNLAKIYVDKFNPGWGVLDSLKKGLLRYDFPNLKLLLYKCNNPLKYSEYSRQLKERTSRIASGFNLLNKLLFCF